MSEIIEKVKELEKRIRVLEDWSGIKSEDEGVHVFPVPELMQEMPMKEYKEKLDVNRAKKIIGITRETNCTNEDILRLGAFKDEDLFKKERESKWPYNRFE